MRIGRRMAGLAGSLVFSTVLLEDVPARTAPGGGLSFVENRGQWRSPARFVARGPAGALHLAADSLSVVRTLRSGGAAWIRLAFEGANPGARLEGVEERPGRSHFFFGNDPVRWRTQVPAFASVVVRELYEGIDLRVREGEGGPAYDLILAPGASLDRVRVRCEGVGSLEVAPDGSLELRTSHGPVRQSRPVAWVEGPAGERREVECRFRTIDPLRYGFEAAAGEGSGPLVIDPVLQWSTFLGGAGDDFVFGLVRAGADDLFVAGETASGDFPATPGAFATTLDGTRDAFVCRIDPTQEGASSLLWSTYLGGSSNEGAYGVILDGSGGVILAGYTDTPGDAPVPFPTTPGALDTTRAGSLDGFLARLDGSGSLLLYSTFLGGSEADWIVALGAASDGTPLLCGITESADLPTSPGAFDSSFNGARDVFVARLDPTASGPDQLPWSTFLGGSGAEGYPGDYPPNEESRHPAMATGPGDSVTIVGRTESDDFPTTAGPAMRGPSDGFVARLDAASTGGEALLWSTLLGGDSDDYPWDVAVDPLGRATVVGGTLSADFPTTPEAFDTSYAVSSPPFIEDAFVTQFDTAGAAFLYSTYLGDVGGDFAFAVCVDATGAATVAGATAGATFPTTAGAYDTTYGGGTGFWNSDVFLARLHPSGSGLLYSTYLGGSGSDLPLEMAQDAFGEVTLGGVTQSPDFPTTPGAFDPLLAGGPVFGDGFLAQVQPLPAGLTLFGDSTPGCDGPLAVGATSMPSSGNLSFALTCSNVPPAAVGFLVLSDTASVPPLVYGGVAIWLDLFATMVFAVASDPVGSVALPLPILEEPDISGFLLHFQFFFPSGCTPSGWSASNAIAVLFQP